DPLGHRDVLRPVLRRVSDDVRRLALYVPFCGRLAPFPPSARATARPLPFRSAVLRQCRGSVAVQVRRRLVDLGRGRGDGGELEIGGRGGGPRGRTAGGGRRRLGGRLFWPPAPPAAPPRPPPFPPPAPSPPPSRPLLLRLPFRRRLFCQLGRVAVDHRLVHDLRLGLDRLDVLLLRSWRSGRLLRLGLERDRRRAWNGLLGERRV